MADIVISPVARSDLREIGDYINRELRSPDAARRLIRRIQDAILPLHDFPEMGTPLLADVPDRIPYRYLICGSYMIFYHFADETAYIDRVLYGRRDYLTLLFGDRLTDEE
ncbi:MAG: type II toxin-antitoxin system RelE/ParE family toxin [Oscillospiraceae bacterium]|nr:type II toxin-antitoxin system RelE/ParE family toxin [Oscillospiraceae bacterium]